MSVYCDWVRWKVWSAASISVWQHVKLSVQIRPWDTLACCWDDKQPTNKQTHPYMHEALDAQLLRLGTFWPTFKHMTCWGMIALFNHGSRCRSLSYCGQAGIEASTVSHTAAQTGQRDPLAWREKCQFTLHQWTVEDSVYGLQISVTVLRHSVVPKVFMNWKLPSSTTECPIVSVLTILISLPPVNCLEVTVPLDWTLNANE